MPGGKKNIKPEDGKQFSSTYQPQEKWTEKNSMKLGYELIEWLRRDEKNIFFDEFLYIENDYYTELISYLANKFSSFSMLIGRAKKIQEIKLMKKGCLDELNAQMTKFTLINNHGWKTEAKEPEKDENKTYQLNFSFGDAELDELVKNKTDGKDEKDSI